MKSLLKFSWICAIIIAPASSHHATAQTPLPYYCPNNQTLVWLPTQPLAGEPFRFQLVPPSNSNYLTRIFETRVNGFEISIDADSLPADFSPVPPIYGNLGPLPSGVYTVTLQMYYTLGGPIVSCPPYVTTLALGSGPTPQAVPTPVNSSLMLWAAGLLLAGVGVWRQRRSR